MPDEPRPVCVVLTPSRRRGRPPVDERKVPLTMWVPEADADRLIRQARQSDVTVSELLRIAVLTLRT